MRYRALSLILALAAPFLASFGPRSADEKIRVLLVTGANNHDWEWTSARMAAVLTESGRFQVDTTREPSTVLANGAKLVEYDVILLDYNGPRWGDAAEAGFLWTVREGTGVVVVHAANNAFPGWVEYEKLVGHLWREGTGHGRFHEFDVKVVDREHPITRNLPDLKSHPDELYHRLVNVHGADHRTLATAFSSEDSGGTGGDEPMILVGTYGNGRVFHTPLGHVWKGQDQTRVSHLDPQFQTLLLRGTEWAATGDVVEGGPEPNRLTDAERRAGWRLLFDGKSTAGWRGFKREAFPEKGWKIDDASLHVVAGGGGGDIVTTGTFGEFELRFDWKVAPGANSGIMYRVGEDDGAPWMTGPEYQILDDPAHPDGRRELTSVGSLYGMLPPTGKVVAPAGRWNSGAIRLEGGRLEHWVNGAKVVSCALGGEAWDELVAGSKFKDFPRFGRLPRGHIAFQDHGNDVWFRNVKVRPLGADATAGSVSLFNGKDLAGWTFHLNDGGRMADVWSVTDEGVLVCLGRPAGYIRTEKDYTNYVLELDWRFNPVTKQPGNSGVLLRMIGEDKVWPRSVEAQLLSGKAGDFWNIDEFPMHVDPERTNGRNTRHLHPNEKPIGEWNHYRITVDRGLIVLEVNGVELNRATDVLEVAGKICLQSEGAEIHFKDIRLTPLGGGRPREAGSGGAGEGEGEGEADELGRSF